MLKNRARSPAPARRRTMIVERALDGGRWWIVSEVD
jgi:hypothetical protein